MSINKTTAFIALLLSFALIINLTRDVYRLFKTRERITRVEERLAQVEKGNQELKETKEYYQSNAFLEEQIRNKLQMAKPGETILILPEEIATGQTSEVKEQIAEEELTNWQKWLVLFK